MEDEPDPRTLEKHICGVTMTDISGREWVCILEPHAKLYTRKKTNGKTHTRGSVIYDNNPKADKHWFVNRYPNRSYKHD